MWWDYHLLGGDRFRTTIEQEATTARAVVVLWCSAAINSHFVIDEADIGLRANKLLQTTLEDVQPPLGFRSVEHRLSLVSWSGSPEDDAIDRLVLAIAQLVQRAPRKPIHLFRALSAGLGRLPVVGLVEDSSLAERQRDTELVTGDDILRSPPDPSAGERELIFFKSCSGPRGVRGLFESLPARPLRRSGTNEN